MEATAVIFLEVSVLVTLIVTLMSCICCTKKQKDTDPESKPQDRLNNNQNLLVANAESRDHRTGDELVKSDHAQMRNRIPNIRELPELPSDNEIDLNRHDSISVFNYERVSEISNMGHTSAYRHSGDVSGSSVTSLNRSISIEGKMHIQPMLSNDSSNVIQNGATYATVIPCSSRHSQNLNDTPPPVPEKLFEQGEPSYGASSNLSAASAVAGNADLPYMTSPSQTVHDLIRPGSATIYEGSSRQRQPAGYDSITVREPLSKILAQTPRHQYEEPEPTYSFVSDDSDQVYEEIQTDKRTLHPPAPPTVESLKNVAQAQHSRQASCSSFTASDITSPHSPTAERNLTQSSKATLTKILEPPPEGLYSVINKQKKVEDLYATVQKDSLKSTGTRPKQSTSGHEPSHHGPSIHGVCKDTGDSKPAKGNSLFRHSSSADDPNYERILDSPSQPLPPGAPQENPNDFEQSKASRTGGSGNHREEPNASDPGYETVAGSKQFGGYETIQGRYSSNSDDENEPGYEKVPVSYHRPYPNYECVDCVPVKNGAAKATPEENTYWQIQGREETNDPFYEKINSQDDDAADPNYEKVKRISERSDEEASEPGYEQVKHTISQNAYEKVPECDELQNPDPGYEKIHENRVELHVEWNGHARPASHEDAHIRTNEATGAIVTHFHHIKPAFSSSETPPDIVLPPTPPGDTMDASYAPLASINGISIYNMAFVNYDQKANGSEIPNTQKDHDEISFRYESDRHDSLL